MLKIVEALAIFFLTRLNNANPHSHPAAIATDFLASKGRLILISLISGIALAILFSGGLILSLVGASFWISDDSVISSHWFVYFGLGLSVLCGLAIVFAFSKKRLNLEIEKPTPKEIAHPISGGQVIEELVLAVLKEFIQPKKPEEKEPHATPTAATSTPTSVYTA